MTTLQIYQLECLDEYREEQVNLSFSIVENIDVLINFREQCERSDEHDVTDSAHNAFEYIFYKHAC